ncbi:MAG TPA: hypothetical protein VFJ61_01100 [Solirubrobacterales bacterium]|nr:hypothetical protein [Solirubrobacterales bacterium]
MSRGIRRQAPVLVAAALVAVAALGGTVYAAGKINGRTIKVKSLPGNRLAPGSVPGNRLRPGTIKAEALAPGTIRGDMLAPGTLRGEQLAPGSVTGVQIDVASLGPMPSAGHADEADVAKSAKDAETALNAANAQNAKTVNGYEAGCKAGTRLYAGACWQVVANAATVTPPTAAGNCAGEGGELPSALALAAFSKQPGVTIAVGGEWTGDIPTVSGTNVYAVVIVTSAGAIKSEPATESLRYRCVIPLLG